MRMNVWANMLWGWGVGALLLSGACTGGASFGPDAGDAGDAADAGAPDGGEPIPCGSYGGVGTARAGDCEAAEDNTAQLYDCAVCPTLEEFDVPFVHCGRWNSDQFDYPDCGVDAADDESLACLSNALDVCEPAFLDVYQVWNADSIAHTYLFVVPDDEGCVVRQISGIGGTTSYEDTCTSLAPADECTGPRGGDCVASRDWECPRCIEYSF